MCANSTNTARGLDELTRYYAALGAGDRSVKLSLSIGFVAVAVAAFVARASPPTGYEVSIYWGTPILVWAALGTAILVAIAVGLFGTSRSSTHFATLLTGTAMFAMVTLPLLRGYYFYGLADGLYHLGWTRLLVSGDWTFTTLIYPGTHSIAAYVHLLTGFAIPRAMLVTIAIFVLVFFLFIPLTVRTVVGDLRVTTVAAFVAVLLIPVNHIDLGVTFDPFSLATMFSPLVLYLCFKHMGTPDSGWFTRPAVLSVFAGGTLVFVHPQTALTLVIVLGGVVGGQLLHRWRRSGHPLARTRPVVLQVAAITAILLVWVVRHELTFLYAQQLLNTLLETLGGSSVAGAAIQSRAQSAQSIGVGLPEVFVKLFFVEAVLAVVSAFYIVRVGRASRAGSRAPGHVLTASLTYGAIAMTPLVVSNVFGVASNYLFRYLGVGLVLLTLVSAVGLVSLQERLWATFEGIRAWRRPVTGVATVLAFLLVAAAMFQSPYIYTQSPHVTETKMAGYEASLEAQPADFSVMWAAVGRVNHRYERALPEARSLREHGPLPPDVLKSGLQAHFANHPEPAVRQDHYVVMTENDWKREVVAFDELHYTEEQLEGLSTQRGVGRVRSNGEFQLYYLTIPDSAKEDVTS